MARRTRIVPLATITVAILALLSWDTPAAQAAFCGSSQGAALLLGCANNTATDETTLTAQTPLGTSALHVIGAKGVGVRGDSYVYGVWGLASGTGTGVVGTGGPTNGVGVKGFGGGESAGVSGRGGANGGYGVEGTGGGYGAGVLGIGGAQGAEGVQGQGSGSGAGVRAIGGPDNGAGVVAYGHGSGTGVAGWGTGTGEGVFGLSYDSNGVHGQSDSSAASGVWGDNRGQGYGVAGSTNGEDAAGVWGSNGGFGIGVKGTSLVGTGVYASGGTVALRVEGKASFSRSGVVTVTAGTSSQTVTMTGVSTSSMVVATAQQAANVWVKAVEPASGSFTIYLTGKAPPTGLIVAYFVLN